LCFATLRTGIVARSRAFAACFIARCNSADAFASSVLSRDPTFAFMAA
jgi:hypothetical protein